MAAGRLDEVWLGGARGGGVWYDVISRAVIPVAVCTIVVSAVIRRPRT